MPAHVDIIGVTLPPHRRWASGLSSPRHYALPQHAGSTVGVGRALRSVGQANSKTVGCMGRLLMVPAPAASRIGCCTGNCLTPVIRRPRSRRVLVDSEKLAMRVRAARSRRSRELDALLPGHVPTGRRPQRSTHSYADVHARRAKSVLVGLVVSGVKDGPRSHAIEERLHGGALVRRHAAPEVTWWIATDNRLSSMTTLEQCDVRLPALRPSHGQSHEAELVRSPCPR